MVLPKSLFSDGVWPRIRTRLPASASRHPYTLLERELGSEACEPHSLSRPWSSSLVRPLAEPFLHPGHRHQMPSVSSGSQGWPLLRRPPEGLVLDGREHGGTLDWHGVRLDALLSAYPSITVKECPSECAPTLTIAPKGSFGSWDLNNIPVTAASMLNTRAEGVSGRSPFSPKGPAARRKRS